VKVTVRDIPAPEPRPVAYRWAPPQAAGAPGDSDAEQEDALYRRFGPYVDALLQKQWGVKPGAAEDLRQEALLLFCRKVRAETRVEKPEAYLFGVLRNMVGNHRRAWAPDVALDADLDAQQSRAVDPEQSAVEKERWAKVERYMTYLTPREAELVELIDFEGLSLAEVAEKLGSTVPTVSRHHAADVDKLAELARKSAEEAAARLGRR
jgi:RNA polymerase sigma-70 factor (ECF subfamily)